MHKVIDDVPEIANPVEIGTGGFGTVYRATDLQANRLVAVKVLDIRPSDSALRAFERETGALGQLSTHPHIVTLYRAGVTNGGNPYLVMEYATGGSLHGRLSNAGPMHWTEAAARIVEVCEGIDAAHNNSIRHRDIKPANILLSEYDKGLLADFGIATLTEVTRTSSRKLTASIAHASPEQLIGADLDARTDIYSTASTLYELIAGRPAFVETDQDSLMSIVARVANHEPEPFDLDVPSGIFAAIRGAMAKSPADRPATIGEFAAQLSDAVGTQGVAEPQGESSPGQKPTAIVPPPTSPPEAETAHSQRRAETHERRAARRPIRWLVAAAVLAGLAAAVVPVYRELRDIDIDQAVQMVAPGGGSAAGYDLLLATGDYLLTEDELVGPIRSSVAPLDLDTVIFDSSQATSDDGHIFAVTTDNRRVAGCAGGRCVKGTGVMRWEPESGAVQVHEISTWEDDEARFAPEYVAGSLFVLGVTGPATAARTSFIEVYSARDLNLQRTIPLWTHEPFEIGGTFVAGVRDGEYFVAWGRNSISIDPTSLEAHRETDGPFYDTMAISGDYVATVADEADGIVSIYRSSNAITSRESIAVETVGGLVSSSGDDVVSLVGIGQGVFVAYGGFDNSIRVFDYQGRLGAEIVVSARPIAQAEFVASHDALYLATREGVVMIDAGHLRQSLTSS